MLDMVIHSGHVLLMAILKGIDLRGEFVGELGL